MLRIQIRPRWEISFHSEAPLDTCALLGLLLAVQDTGSKVEMPVELRYRNSTDAVAALSRRECDLEDGSAALQA